MPGTSGYILWCVGFLLEAYIVVYCLCRKNLLRYFALNCYMLITALATLGLFVVFQRFGFSSIQYRYYYFYSETLSTVLLFFAIIELYRHVLSKLDVTRFVRIGALMLFVGTAAFAYSVVRHNIDHLTSRFVVELSQDLFFVGLVLTYLLWAAVLKFREERTRVVQFVLALGIYFSAAAAAYAFRNLYPKLTFPKDIMPFVNLWLPFAWAYTLTFVPEEARLVARRLVPWAAQ
jgi:hypothetical protein